MRGRRRYWGDASRNKKDAACRHHRVICVLPLAGWRAQMPAATGRTTSPGLGFDSPGSYWGSPSRRRRTATSPAKPRAKSPAKQPVVGEAKHTPAVARDKYYRGQGHRPALRGAVMKLLLPYWPTAALGHAVICTLVLEPSPVSVRSMLRALVAIATSLNVFFSDRFHNSDTHGASLPLKERRVLEVFWLRLDFTGISFVLSSTFALWSCHFAWSPPFVSLTLLGFGATCLVACAAFALFERDGSSRAGEVVIKLTLGVQYIFLFGYMVIVALQTPCAPHAIIWFTYLPVSPADHESRAVAPTTIVRAVPPSCVQGFVAYTLGRPVDGPAWGAHDVFHVCVLLGHVMSAGCDTVNVPWQCIGS